MLSSILTIVASVGAISAGILAYKNSANRQRRNAEKDIAEKEAMMQAKKDEIRQAVYTNDDAKINDLASTILSPCCCTLAVISFVLGCATKSPVVYVPTDRRIETCTNSIGIVCKAVPNAVFCELLEKAQELKDLKTEMAVDKRVQK